MLKLYKRDENGKVSAYHEVWVEPENRRIVAHWGKLGEDGEAKAYRVKLLRSLEKQVDDIIAPARHDGFAPLSAIDHASLIIEYTIEGAGDAEDLDKRHNLEEAINQKLGWTGLGHCDGGSTGAGTMEVACFVVDFELAKQIISDTLKDTEFGDFSRIYQQ